MIVAPSGGAHEKRGRKFDASGDCVSPPQSSYTALAALQEVPTTLSLCGKILKSCKSLHFQHLKVQTMYTSAKKPSLSLMLTAWTMKCDNFFKVALNGAPSSFNVTRQCNMSLQFQRQFQEWTRALQPGVKLKCEILPLLILMISCYYFDAGTVSLLMKAFHAHLLCMKGQRR